jgi:hypothetical protein
MVALTMSDGSIKQCAESLGGSWKHAHFTEMSPHGTGSCGGVTSLWEVQREQQGRVLSVARGRCQVHESQLLHL